MWMANEAQRRACKGTSVVIAWSTLIGYDTIAFDFDRRWRMKRNEMSPGFEMEERIGLFHFGQDNPEGRTSYTLGHNISSHKTSKE
ncbi:hypothetical protein L484_003299 [Morus notabilis]|uniref:Uncharacterized protein n=1 Tax=Morus notabilis TaxID=981085 RepID=W9QQ89_9ROSA|nr:hypothetical protein L484_003299 [Morus notabilis]